MTVYQLGMIIGATICILLIFLLVTYIAYRVFEADTANACIVVAIALVLASVLVLV